jgi:tetratricopeptide (TPR) repeat protein
LVTVAALLALLFGLPTHAAEEVKLAEAIRARRSVDEVRAVAVQALRRHPSDWVIYAKVAADFAQRADPRESLAWVNRLLFLRPFDAGAHVAAGNALVRMKLPLQALGEFKSAWLLGDSSSLDVALNIAVKEQAYDRVLIDREGHLTQLWAALRARNLPMEALALLDSVEVSAVGDAVRAEAAVLRVRQESDLGDPARAFAAWEALPEAEKVLLPQQSVRVTLLERLGRDEEALSTMERLVARSPNELGLTLRYVGMLAHRGRPTVAREVLERARPFFMQPELRAALFRREAALFSSEERWGRALEALQTASRLQPTRPELHYEMATLFERMGSLHSALDEVRKGRLLDTPAGAKAQDPTVQRLEAGMATGN